MAKNFTAVSGEDWAYTAEVKSDTDDSLVDLTEALIELQVQDPSCGGKVVLEADTTGTITKPELGHFTWRFTAVQMSALSEGKQYNVAARMVLDGATTMLFLTTLVIQKTGFVWK